MRTRTLLVPGLLALAVAGCGSSGGSQRLTRAQIDSKLAGSPPALASLHRQASRLLGGGLTAFRARLRALRGHPVVVNRWASWCGPCRSEYTVLQRVSASAGKRVAFLGLDNEKSASKGEGFLRSHFVPYPSFEDGGTAISKELGITLGMPITAFLDARGKLVFRHAGPYTSEKDLLADISRYATG